MEAVLGKLPAEDELAQLEGLIASLRIIKIIGITRTIIKEKHYSNLIKRWEEQTGFTGEATERKDRIIVNIIKDRWISTLRKIGILIVTKGKIWNSVDERTIS